MTVIDANSPADVLESFHVCSSHLLCIASVPGAKVSLIAFHIKVWLIGEVSTIMRKKSSDNDLAYRNVSGK